MNDRPKLTRPSEVRAWITDQQFLPSKVLGQNFLIDENILRIMIDSAEVTPTDGILEVGPGLGILTEPLISKARQVVAIEKDKRLAAYLSDAFAGRDNFSLIQADALKINLAETKDAHRLNKFVSNLPYSVGSRVLVECFLLSEGFDTLVVTVQLEVGERLAAKVNTSEYGLLSIWAQTDYRVTLAKRISPSCFHPRPQVTSAIVVLKREHNRRAQMKNPAIFDSLIRHAFSRRRKQLGTILAGFHIAGAAVRPVDAVAALGIAPARRPETLTVDEWVALADAIA